MAVDTTYTSATYDGYIDASECTTLVNALDGMRSLDKYNELSTTQIENLIKYASREANGFKFSGTVVADVVAADMQWPRSGVYYQNGEVVSATAIPDFIKRFTAYRVLELADNPITGTYEPEQAIKRQKLEGLEVEYQDNNGATPSTSITRLPAFKEIAPYVLSAALYTMAVRA